MSKASPTTSKQRLALAICNFLSTSLTDGTLTSPDDRESIEVAINCISESFKVDPTDATALRSAIGNQNLLQIYGVYEKMKGSSSSSSSSTNPSSDNTANDETTGGQEPPRLPTEEEKSQAEDLKVQGNKAMTSKDYPRAIDMYTRALALHPGNAIFLSNRAAAYSAFRDHESARADAEAAVAVDPSYTKAWSRLGLARFALGDARGSMEAYKKGIEHEGSGGSDAMKRGFETAKRRVEELDAEERASSSPSPATRGAQPAAPGGMPDLASLASMFGGGGAGGGGGGGGMPDLSSIMSNPMFASMAQSLMSNPDMMNNLMSNPRLREMAERFGSGGGGMPDIGALMSDPGVAEMARNMMGGGGGGAGNPGAGRGAGGGAPGGGS
ncbi:hypothetical protein F5Y16DRAFT_406185 [Xylariaceae sp. FL0255]|nr:hypothetical protein F5Y16DRAFT_406185 [Xylariaceae sp. FL0255]